MTLSSFVRHSRVLFVLLALAGCGHGNADVPGSIEEVNLDPQSGYVASIRLDLGRDEPAAAAAPGTYDFVVTSNGRFSSFWTASNVTAGTDDRVTIVLHPTSPEASPTIGASLTVKAVSHATGKETLLAQTVVKKPPDLLLNPSLANFANFPNKLPAGWDVTGNALSGGSVTRQFIDGQHGVNIRLQAQSRRDWNTYSVWQDVNLESIRNFSLLVRPTRDCDADTSGPTEVSGVTLSDGTGHVAQFCVSPRMHQPRINEFADGREVITIFPGKIDRWNRVTISLDALQPYFRLYPDKDGNVRMSLGINIHPKAVGDRLPFDSSSFADVRAGDNFTE